MSWSTIWAKPVEFKIPLTVTSDIGQAENNNHFDRFSLLNFGFMAWVSICEVFKTIRKLYWKFQGIKKAKQP